MELYDIQADEFERFEPTDADFYVEGEDDDYDQCQECGDRLPPFSLSPICDYCDASGYRKYFQNRS